MKKLLSMFILLFVLSLPVFAEGDIPFGGKSCPNNQTACRAAEPETPDVKTEITIYEQISVFLKSIFG